MKSRTGSVVLHMQHAFYFMGATGRIRLFQGSAVLEFTNTGATKDLFGGQFYDPVSSAVISNQTQNLKMVPTVSDPEISPDWQYLTPAPRITNMSEVPQRPF